LDGLKDLPVTMNPYLSDTTPNFWLSCILLEPSCAVKPMQIIDRLAQENIESRPIWKPMHLQPVFAQNDFISVDGDVGADIFARGVCLPSDIKMTPQQQDHVIQIIKSLF
jgi:dTDP-4-amino-4,6-dideoxygalactose transaminase